ncbi:hypothetical protein DAEQUDRAFT_754079 [Daedalea quercina L-15889]|uniref:F-box domain-containing protein n=1 Tax=Daedalea quercina L-15889 TaxID=1314783 RepID=A0A165TY03_9APHY|nr:hypothetical protein DAEQUDRAFT_754079 [Daedalea quercina L-15889]
MSTSSRKALNLPEILFLIFAQLAPSVQDRGSDLPSNRRALGRASRVCRTFSGPALKTLWRHIDNLVPLVRLLTCARLVKRDDIDSDNDELYDSDDSEEELDYTESTWVLVDDISHEDWERFTRYAAYVRVVNLDKHDRKSTIDPSVYSEISRKNEGRPPLPHLKELRWKQVAAGDETILTVIPSSLRRLCFQAKDHVSATPSYRRSHRSLTGLGELHPRDCALRTLLNAVLTKGSDVEHLTLRGISNPMIFAPLSKCERLRALDIILSLHNPDVGIIQIMEAFTSISTLTTLKLVVRNWCELEEHLRQLEQFETFQPLARLREGKWAKTTSTPAMRSSSLRNLTVDIRAADADMAVLPSLLKTLPVPSLVAHLRSLRLRYGNLGWTPRRGFMLGGSQGLVSLYSFLAPLIPLQRLEQLYVLCKDTRFACTDENMKLLTRHWPKLTAFVVDFDSPRGASSYPSAHVLADIAKGWPMLRVLCLPSIGDLSTFPSLQSVCPHRSLRQLRLVSDVKLRHPNDAKNFAVYLAVQFPNLVSPFTDLGDDEPDTSDLCTEWLTIFALVDQARSFIRTRYPTIYDILSGVAGTSGMAT